jgi:20S proteasome subunit beta 3
MAESLWKEDLEPEDLFEVTSQALLASVDRDCYSGWGGKYIYNFQGVCHIITPDKIITNELKGRMD